MSIALHHASSSELALSGDYLRQSCILWVRRGAETNEADGLNLLVQQLSLEMHRHGLRFETTSLDELPSRPLAGVDLVLLDAFEDFENVIQIAAIRVRLKSRVPLVLLTRDYTSEQLVLALKSGVDAILSCQTPPDLILARCNAMIRRWRLSTAPRSA